MQIPTTPTPDRLPDPWLFDSEALLRELDRCRETVLRIPTNGDCNATHFGIQHAVNAIWNLTENLRYILHLHREGQRAFRRKHATPTNDQADGKHSLEIALSQQPPQRQTHARRGRPKRQTVG